MRTLLLLLISLMTGRDAAANKEQCSETWAKCKYPEEDRTYQRIEVDHQSHTGSSKETNTWENEGSFFLYHDTRRKKLRVVFTQSHKRTDGFQCRFYQKTTKPQKQNLEKSHCTIQLNTTQTYSSATTNITCGSHQARVHFFCKQVGSRCQNILFTSPQASDSRFSLSAGTVSIRDVSSQDQGVYWCGLTANAGGYRAALRKIRLEVHASQPQTTTITSITSSTTRSTSTTTCISASAPSVASTSSAPGGGLAGLTAALVSVAVLLLLVLTLLWVYMHFKNTTKGGVQVNKEEHGYAEIQERPPKPDSGAAMHNTYVTATFPTNPSAFLHGSSDPAGAGDVLYWTIDLPQT